MRRFRVFVSLILASGTAAIGLGACAQAQTSRLRVVTSTTLLSYIVQQVAGNAVDVYNVVPASQHPGDFDPRPGDIEALSKASLFFVHGFPGETYVQGMVSSANNHNLKVITVDEGNASWMTPEVQLDATDKITAAFDQADPKNKDIYDKGAARYKDLVRAKETQVKSELAKANVSSLVAISSIFQEPFATWAGIKVVGDYMDAQSLTPQRVKDLVDTGRASGVNLIIDNVHSDRDAGKGLAEELGAKRIILVYFPGGFPNTETWEKSIDYDVAQIIQATK